jgi:transcriptional regulator with XRE-family HTH domain
MNSALTIPDVMIGPKIQEVFERKNIKLSDFADDLGTVRQNVYRIFKKKDLDTGLLIKVSEVLNHNFFKYYQTPAATTGDTEPGASDLTQELELARKEIDYLKKIILLMEEKARLLQAMHGSSLPEDQHETRQKENGIAQKSIALF